MLRGRALLMGALTLAILVSLVGCTDRLQVQAPKALFALRPAEGEAPLTVSFDGSPSFAANGSVTEYVWDFGDGTKEVGAMVSHTYETGGTYEVILEVFNEQGKSDRRSTKVVVHYPAPTAEFTYVPDRPAVGERVRFNAEGSTTPNGEIEEYRWAFGDGNSSDEGSEVEHVYWNGRTYSVTLTVIDAAGQKDRTTKRVEIQGGEPCKAL
ncbi:MAG: PKD domain-containing protein [Candidatus Bipolaricaulota bacterium]